ncbi:MAG: hypothetical protein VYE73_16535, partial [Acidobacteriota bacterium]|nr:hypothetical protein [Acidobacteriota bacterium]
MRRLTMVLACVLSALVAHPRASGATEVKLFLTQTQDAFLEGTLESISVDSLGVLRLASRVEVVASIDEPFLLSASRRLDGWVVGTGNAGRVIAVDPAGQAEI